MKKRHTDLPYAAVKLSAGNWAERISRLASQTARDALADSPPAQCMELAFALLHTYFMLSYAAALPFLEHDGALAARLDTLRKIIKSAGITFDTTICCTELRHD